MFCKNRCFKIMESIVGSVLFDFDMNWNNFNSKIIMGVVGYLVK